MEIELGKDRTSLSPRRERSPDRRDSGNSNGHSKRRSSGSRRRRPTLWDVREPPYGIPMPPPGSSLPTGQPNPRAGTAPTVRPTDVGSRGAVPGPNDIVRAPREGETGPLAGINIDALRALLNPHGLPVNSGMMNIGSMQTAQVGMSGARADVAAGGMGAAGVLSPQTSAQTSRHARRLYVGNLPADTTDAQIGDFFNRALKASKGVESEGDPVISVYINLEKRFAFIETRTVREAAAGLSLDGVRFRDMFLRLRRPNDYNAATAGNPRPPDGFNPSILGIVSTQVSDGPNKVFIGGIPYNLTEEQIKSLLQSYGPLAAFNLIKEPSTGMSKGFAFFEFVDPSVVDAACAGLHGMQVGDKTLTVRRASSSAGGNTATHASMGTSVVQDGGAARPPVSANVLLTSSTTVVELRNVVTKEEVANDEEFEDIKDDMEEEAGKFGKLESVVIPRPRDGPGMEAGIGRVFLKYSTKEEAERAHATMSGRRFGENTVEATFFDEERFARREF